MGYYSEQKTHRAGFPEENLHFEMQVFNLGLFILTTDSL